eukprot:469631-Alexandrium_andersonii.AAC.1
MGRVAAQTQVRSLADDLLVTTRCSDVRDVHASVAQHGEAVTHTVNFLESMGARISIGKRMPVSSDAEARKLLKRTSFGGLGAMPVAVHMRDLGSHMSLGKTRCGSTITARIKDATAIARGLAAFPTGRKQRVAVLKGKVLPKSMYGVEAAPTSRAALK